eukprot:6190305-Amphidinium_carterae.2
MSSWIQPSSDPKWFGFDAVGPSQHCGLRTFRGEAVHLCQPSCAIEVCMVVGVSASSAGAAVIRLVIRACAAANCRLW